MNKFQKSIISAFVLSLVMSIAIPADKSDKLIFSGFSLGWSSKVDGSKNEDRIKIVDDDTEVEYSFKLADWFAALFK